MIGFPNELTTVDRTPRCLTVAHHGGPLRGGAGARLLTEAATANHKSERHLAEELTLFLIDLIRKQKEREQQ
jgi:hypothetical protein